MEQKDGQLSRRKKKLAAEEVDVLKRSCRTSRIERIRNERINELVKIKGNLLGELKKSDGHVKRMSD